MKYLFTEFGSIQLQRNTNTQTNQQKEKVD